MPAMTLGNMRANGVRTLAAWCLGRGCNHFRVLDVSGFGDDLPVPSFGPRLRCERCGHLGADARPNWNEMHKQECSMPPFLVKGSRGIGRIFVPGKSWLPLATPLPVCFPIFRALLDLAKAFGHEVGGGRIVIQKISQSDIADMAGIARENVSRILNKWMRLKLVTRLSGYYCLESAAKLEKEIDL
jgi:hypothetical protein